MKLYEKTIDGKQHCDPANKLLLSGVDGMPSGWTVVDDN